jgi:phage protein D
VTTARDAPVFYVLVQPEGAPEATRLDLTSQVLSFEYEDSEKKADLLKLSVNNWDLRNFDDPVWKQGNKLIVAWGYASRLCPARECIIQKVTGAQTLTVEAQAKSVLLNKEVKSKTYENTTRSEIVHAIAKEHGYGDDQRDIEETREVFVVTSQARATDAQFIKRLADIEGFEFYVDFDGFHWHPRRLGQKPLRVLQWYLPPDVGDIESFTVENDIFAKPAKVQTKGIDPLAKKEISGEGSDAKTARTTLAPMPDLIAVDSTTGVFSTATQVASSEVRPTTETSATAAKREAEGVFRRVQQTTVKLNMGLVGDPDIFAKSVLEVRGLGKRLSGLYYVNQANHKIDGSGYKLALKTSSDGTHGHSESLTAADTTTPSAASKAALNKNRGETTNSDNGKLTEQLVIDPASGAQATAYTFSGKPQGDVQ